MKRTQAGRIWTPGMMSSLRHDWATPRALFHVLDEEFHFTLDVCATAETAVCEEYFSEGALDRLWVPVNDGAVWCNPPYGRRIGDWVEKAWRESCSLHRGISIVLLLAARTDTQWFHEYCLKGEIRFLRGRLSFDDQKLRGRAPFPSMIVIFRGTREREVSSAYETSYGN